MKVGLKAWRSSWGLVAGVSNVFPNYFGFSGLPESCEVVCSPSTGSRKRSNQGPVVSITSIKHFAGITYIVYIIYRGHLHVSIYILVGTLILNS